MAARLYWFPLSHPAQAARRALEVKGIPYETVTLLPGLHPPVLRAAGFRGGTVPALKLDGRRIQGSRAITRELDRVAPDPPLFPADAEERARVEAAERWGEEELQPVPRRALRWALTRDRGLREWLARSAGMPVVMARVGGPQARLFARMAGASEAAVRADLAALPARLDRVDGWLADGTLAVDPPNAAALQILATVAALAQAPDLAPLLDGRPCRDAALRLFPDVPGPLPAFLPVGLRP